MLTGANMRENIFINFVPSFMFSPGVLYDPGCLLDQKDTRSCKTHKARLCYHLCVQKDTSPKHVPLHAPVTCSSVFLTPLSGSIPGQRMKEATIKPGCLGLSSPTWR